MDGWKYDPKERLFEGKISFDRGGGFFKDSDSELNIYFSSDFISIERSDQYIFKDKGEPFKEFAG